jgi:hypothetical protein
MEDGAKMDAQPNELIPIYTTLGDWFAMLVYPYIFNTIGEWIAWVTPGNQIYDVEGGYVGFLTDEPRILRRRVHHDPIPKRTPPPAPDRIRTPSLVPLPPMMHELPYGIIDVCDEEPHRLHTFDHSRYKEDMD